MAYALLLSTYIPAYTTLPNKRTKDYNYIDLHSIFIFGKPDCSKRKKEKSLQGKASMKATK